MNWKVSIIGMHSHGVDYLIALAFQSGVKNRATQSICIDIQHLTIIYTYNINYTLPLRIVGVNNMSQTSVGSPTF